MSGFKLLKVIPLREGNFDSSVCPPRRGKIRTLTGSFTKSPPLPGFPPPPRGWPMIGTLLAALKKKIEKIIRKRFLNKGMKNTYEIYPGLALVRLRTTGP